MADEDSNYILAIDDEIFPAFSVAEAQALKPIQKEFMESYLEHRNSMPVEEWLRSEMAKNLPDHSAEEIVRMSDEIIATLKVQEERKASLEEAVANGRSKESWFASEAKKATAYMSAQEASQYLQGLDSALNTANESLHRTIYTQAGLVSQNPHLDGFIAEQYHAQTFNLNAEATGSVYRAKVLEPTGSGYAKNSVDIVIVDESGAVVRRYQSKYCKNPEATAQAFDHGNYRGQQKLVPAGQEQSIAKKTTTVIEAPDGTTSSPLSKERAKEMQNEAQSGRWNDLNWNEYKAKDLAIGIGKQTAQAALMGAAIGVGFDVAQKVWNGEEIKGEELVKTAVVTGADFGIKVAAAGALKVGAEKGIISIIPKGTPASTITNIAFIGIENAKIVGKMASGEYTVKAGFEKIEQTTVASLAGIAASEKEMQIGLEIGSKIVENFGFHGAMIGGFIGGTVGFMAGSTVGQTVVKGVQKIREKATDVVKAFGKAATNAVSSFASNICSGIRSLFCF